ncbi:MAG: hypothetical protein ACE5EA_06220 [Nitrospirota bacterium]
MKERRPDENDLLLTPYLIKEEVADILSPYCFKDVQRVYRTIQFIAREPYHKRLFAKTIIPFLHAVSNSPDPDACLINFERFSSAVFDMSTIFMLFKSNKRMLQLCAVLFSHSQSLSNILIRNPEYLWWLLESGIKGKPLRKMRHEIDAMVSSLSTYESKLNAIRRFKRREMLRIGLMDIFKGIDVAKVTKELSNLADLMLQVIYNICYTELKKRYGVPMYKRDDKDIEGKFAIISLGKLGGRELNFSSDIDIIFIYDSDGTTSGGEDERISNNLFFIKLGEEILKGVGEITEEGNCYRVDMRLRPEGKRGALVRSLESYERYYKSHSEIWERQALIKARFSAGDKHLGKRFSKIIQSIIYNISQLDSVIFYIRRIKERIDQKINVKGLRHTHVKLGYGGIREIEFIVQTLQLLYGGQDNRIRDNNTLSGIKRLYKNGYLKEEEYCDLSAAYRFMRKVEHRIQIVHDQQTHTIPKDTGELQKLIKRLGYKGKKANEEFVKEYRSYTEKVRIIYNSIFYRKH